jgi:hypothetical protein
MLFWDLAEAEVRTLRRERRDMADSHISPLRVRKIMAGD